MNAKAENKTIEQILSEIEERGYCEQSERELLNTQVEFLSTFFNQTIQDQEHFDFIARIKNAMNMNYFD